MNLFFGIVLAVLVLYTVLMFGLFIMGINISLKQYLDVEVGSNIFGLPNMSGVGISFGADRIYDVLKGLDKFPSEVTSTTRLLFANMGADELRYLLPVVKSLREAGVSCEIYPENSKLKKQFDYADKKHIPFLSIVGGNEAEAGVINVKNLSTGEQKSFGKDNISDILAFLA